MVAPLTPLKAVKCSYESCAHSFNSESEMKKHKHHDHKYYCKKCNRDNDSWEQSLNHKVETMVPWLVGELRNEVPKLFKHIVCEFCGEDFGSLGGRKLHQQRVRSTYTPLLEYCRS